MEKNPNTTLAMVAAILEAQNLMYTQTEKAVDSYARYAQTKDRATAEKQIRDYLGYAQRDLRWSKAGWDTMQQVMATQDAALKNVDVTKAYSLQYLDRLRELGFNEAIGLPRS